MNTSDSRNTPASTGQTPAWLAYAGIPLDQIPDDGQREEVRRHREESRES